MIWAAVSPALGRSEERDEVLVIARCQSRASFEAWVGSEEIGPPSAHAVPRLALTAIA